MRNLFKRRAYFFQIHSEKTGFMAIKTKVWDESHKDFNPSAPEPVITYDHMEQDSGMKSKPAGQMPVWSFLIEEITIIGLLTALYLSL